MVDHELCTSEASSLRGASVGFGPCPGDTLSARRTGLLERDADLEPIAAALRRAAGGSGGFVTIAGAAGIGKTSLLGEVADRAEADGMAVLRARGGVM